MRIFSAVAVICWIAGCTGQELATVAGGLPPGTGPVVADVDMANPYATPSTCTSKSQWTRGDRGSQLMHPGAACVDCHSSGRGPDFTIAGTIYPTAHEPDDCNGLSGADGTRVVITDAAGRSHTLTPNSAGNFYYQGALTPPFSAKVTKGGTERVMVGQQTTGDCNSCHTEAGDSAAPGRIMAP